MFHRRWRWVGIAIAHTAGISAAVFFGIVGDSVIPALLAYAVSEILVEVWRASRRRLKYIIPLYDTIYWTTIFSTFTILLLTIGLEMSHNKAILSVFSGLSMPIMVNFFAYADFK